MPERIAIVGGAALTALGADLATTLERLQGGERAVKPWPQAAAWGGLPPWVACVEDGAGAGGLSRLLGRHGAWLERVGRAAHAAGGLATVPRGDVGLYGATGMAPVVPEDLAGAVRASRGPAGELDLARFYGGAYREIHPHWPLSMLPNVAVGELATSLDLRGDHVVLEGDGAAGVRAVAEAVNALQAGVVRAALVVGVAEPLSEAGLRRRALAGRLARGPDAPQAGRVIPGEGAAALALEGESSAASRGAGVLGWITGHATGCCVRDTDLGDGWVTVADAALQSARRGLGEVGLLLTDVVELHDDSGHGVPRDGAARAVLRRPGGEHARAPSWASASMALGAVGGAGPCLDALLAIATLRARGPRPPPQSGGSQRASVALVLASSDGGAVGALVVETA